jgi:hypothetical protein
MFLKTEVGLKAWTTHGYTFDTENNNDSLLVNSAKLGSLAYPLISSILQFHLVFKPCYALVLASEGCEHSTITLSGQLYLYKNICSPSLSPPTGVWYFAYHMVFVSAVSMVLNLVEGSYHVQRPGDLVVNKYGDTQSILSA